MFPTMAPGAWRSWAVTGLLVAFLLVVYWLAPMAGRWWWLGALSGFLVAVAIVPLSVHGVRRILVATQPLAQTVRALVLLLLLLVLSFSTTYYAMEQHRPGQVAGLETKTDALYMTVTTLATVGYGDVHPAGQAARLVAVVNMVFNVIVVAVAVRAITWAGRHRLGLRGVGERTR
jgi:hypothetical protein